MANPHGHGPPPYHGYPPHPSVSNVAFVPAPVMMPIYPPGAGVPDPNPTYVTNYYYSPSAQQQQPPVAQPVDEPIDWISVTTTNAENYAYRAFVAGKEAWDGSSLYIIRAHHNGEFIPGKLAIKHRAAYIPYNGKEVPVHNFELLLAQSSAVRWIASNNGQVPVGAIPAGNTHTGEPLYIARVHHMGSTTPGKVHPSHQCAYICFGGIEHSYRQYEVLCKIVG